MNELVEEMTAAAFQLCENVDTILPCQDRGWIPLKFIIVYVYLSATP